MISNHKRQFILQFIAASLVAFGVVACRSSGVGVPGGLPNSTQRELAALKPNPQGQVVGQGNVRISLLLPTSAPGNAAVAATELKNGALLAMQDFGMSTIQLVIKDTQGHTAEAQRTAREAIEEGSSLILGPLFAANVSAASGMTIPSNISMLAFSTDSSVARRGVYLMSFTPEDDTRRIIEYTISLGRKSIAAFLPNSAEGTLRENTLRQVTGPAGVNLQVFRYQRTPEGISATAAEAVPLIQDVDTIYIPEGGQVPTALLTILQRNGVILENKQALGSGSWESVKTSDSVLAGALYPGRDITAFNDFAQRYQSQYSVTPGVQAALGYDAITLVSELLRLNNSRAAFNSKTLETRQGFRGVNGIFRLRSSGTTQRGLAIYQIRDGRGQLAIPAPANFIGETRS